MTVQSVRQEARRAAREAQAERRRERMLKEKRCEDLAVELAAALAERDRLVRRQQADHGPQRQQHARAAGERAPPPAGR